MHKQIICMPRRVMQLCFDTRAQKQTKFLCLIWMSSTPMWNELKESYNPCCNVTFLSRCFLDESPPWERTWSAQHQSFSLRCDTFNAAPQNKQLRKRFPGSKSRHSVYFANHKLCMNGMNMNRPLDPCCEPAISHNVGGVPPGILSHAFGVVWSVEIPALNTAGLYE